MFNEKSVHLDHALVLTEGETERKERGEGKGKGREVPYFRLTLLATLTKTWLITNLTCSYVF